MIFIVEGCRKGTRFGNVRYKKKQFSEHPQFLKSVFFSNYINDKAQSCSNKVNPFIMNSQVSQFWITQAYLVFVVVTVP